MAGRSGYSPEQRAVVRAWQPGHTPLVRVGRPDCGVLGSRWRRVGR